MLIAIVTALAVGVPSDFPNPKRAEADLAAGTPVFVKASGVAGPGPLSPRYDPEFGLPIEDTGCMPVADAEYNAIVRKWIAANGLPKNSVKPRFVTLEAVEQALKAGRQLKVGGAIDLGDWRMTMDRETLNVTKKGATEPTVRLWAALPEAVVAIRGDSAFVRTHDGTTPVIVHLDLQKGAFIQRLLPKQK